MLAIFCFRCFIQEPDYLLFGYVQTKVIMPGIRKYIRRLWARLRNTFTKDQFTQTDGHAQSSAEFNGRQSVLTTESGESSRQTATSSAEIESGADLLEFESSRQTSTNYDAQFLPLEKDQCTQTTTTTTQTDVFIKPCCAQETMTNVESESGAASRQSATRCATSHDAQFVSLECHY